jgi:N12 class adenine-specific DNA methylase
LKPGSRREPFPQQGKKKARNPPLNPPPKEPEAPTESKDPTLEDDLGTLGEKPPEVRLGGKIGKIDTYGRLRRTKTRLTKQIDELPEDKRAPLIEQLEAKEKELYDALTPEERAKFEKKPKGKKKEKPPEPEETPEDIAAREQKRIDEMDKKPFEDLAAENEGINFSMVFPSEKGDLISFHDDVSGGDFEIYANELTPESLKAKIAKKREELGEKEPERERVYSAERELLDGEGSLSDRLNSALDRVDADTTLTEDQKKVRKTALQVKYNEIADKTQKQPDAPKLTEEERKKIRDDVADLEKQVQDQKDRIAIAGEPELSNIRQQIESVGWDEHTKAELAKAIADRVAELREKEPEFEAEYIDPDNIQLRVKKLNDGRFSVSAKDLDAGMDLGTVTIYKTREEALKRFGSEKEKMILRTKTRKEKPAPIDAYHGSLDPISKFERQNGFGMHFGTEGQAKFMAGIAGKGKGEPGSIMRVKLDIKNPLRMHDTGFTDPSIMATVFPLTDVFTQKELDALEKGTLEDWRKAIQGKGYDGVVYKNLTKEGPGDSYIAFEPEQVTIEKAEKKGLSDKEKDLKFAVEKGGATFTAWNQDLVTKSFPKGLVQFESPFTGSTLNLPPNKVTPEAVAEKMADNYVKTDPGQRLKPWAELDSLTQEQKSAIISGEKELIDYVDIKSLGQRAGKTLDGESSKAGETVEGEGEGSDVLPEPTEEGGGPGGTDVEEGAEPRSGEGSGKKPVLSSKRKRPAKAGGKSQSRPGNNYSITDPAEQENLSNVRSLNERFNRNYEAIKLLKELEESGKKATPEQQKTLVKYVGWGGLPQVFDYYAKAEWQKAREQLEEILTDEEFEAAKRSTPNAHYTSPKVIDLVYNSLKQMGFKGGKVLEPAAGIGHFLGMMPQDLMGRSKFTGIELDPISARIAQQLYQGHDIKQSGYEDVRLPNNFYDVAVGNVPFGDYKVYDPEYKTLKVPIHDYFFIKTLDKVKPGGLAVLITSRYTLDKQNSRTRQMIAEKADLVAAFRLPDTAFKGIANTEVVADIIILRKKVPGKDFKGQEFLQTKELSVKDEDQQGKVSINEYFHKNPKMVLGEHGLTGSMYAENTYTVKGEIKEERKTYEVGKELLGSMIENLPSDIYEEGTPLVKPIEPSPEDIIGVKGDVREGGYKVDGSKIYKREGDKMVKVDFVSGNIVRAKRLIAVKDAVRDFIRIQLEREPGERQPGDIWERHIKDLNRAYDDFVKKHGYINSKANRNLLEGDPDIPILLAIEKYDPKTGKAVKTAFFTELTISRYAKPEKADTAQDAMFISLNELGRVDFDRIKELTGREPDEAQLELQGQIFKNPEGEAWEIADEYLTGDVKSKLETAREAAKFDETYVPNVEALEKNQPPDVLPEDITTRLGVTWIPQEDYKNFIKEILGHQAADVKVDWIPGTGGWIVRGKQLQQGESSWSATNYPQSKDSKIRFATSERTTMKILEAAFNSRNIVIKIYDDDGKVVGTDQVATAENKRVLEEIQDLFKEWILKDQERRERLAAKYNDEMNRIRPRNTYDGSHLTLPGSNPAIKLRPHQKNGAWRIITSKHNTLLEHEVGAGKTYTIIAAAMESKRLGLVKKPMITCFKHQVPDFQKSIFELYPAARVLVPTQADFSPANRKKIQAQIATGNWDIVVLSHEQAEKLSMSKKAQRDYIEEQLAELDWALHDAKRQGLRSKDPTVKQIEKAKMRLMGKLKALMDKPKDSGVTFEELGVDMLLVDEAQKYKNLQYTSTRSRVSGLGNPDGSQRANDLFMKTRYISKMNGGKGIVFTTATPVTNSMVEMYSVLRYLYPDALEQRGISQFDAWANQFGQDVTALEIEPTGQGFRLNTRFRRFVNMPELMQLYREVSDIQTQEMLKLPRPKIKGGAQEAVAVEATEAQQAFVQELVDRAEHVRGGGVDPRDDNMLKITTDGRKAAVDMRLINPSEEDDPGSKLNQAVNGIFDIWNRTAKDKSTQLVFSDLGTPATKGFNVYQDMKGKLIRLGIPANEIAFIHDAKSEMQKQVLFDDVVEGKVRILFGSSEKMGTGMNVQKKLIALHHIDPPWTPALIEQREGRILRQGNDHPEVEIFRYATTGTFDAYMWQTLENKQGFLSQVKRGDISRTIEDIDGRALSFAEMKAIASGDPIVRERIETEMRVNELRNLHQGWQRKRWGNENTIARGPYKIEGYQEEINLLEADIALRDKYPVKVDEKGNDIFEMDIGGTNYPERKEAGKAFLDFFNEMKPIKPDDDSVLAGKYRGFKIRLKKFRTLNPRLFLKGAEGTYEVSLPWDMMHSNKETGKVEDISKDELVGITQRISNELDKLERYVENDKGYIASIEEEIAAAKKSLEEPFKHEAELREKEQKMDDLLEELEPGDEETGETPVDVKKEEYDPDKGIFRIRKDERGEQFWESVRGEKVELQEGFDFFVYKDAESDSWQVTEQSTGLRISLQTDTKNEAIESARENIEKAGIDRMKEAIEKQLQKNKEYDEENKVEEPLASYDMLKDDAKEAFGGKRRQDRVLENVAKQLDLFAEKTGLRSLTQSVKDYKSSIANDLRKNKYVDFRGRTLTKGNEAQELAELFQLFRNPKIEIMHEIYTDAEGNIVAHTAVTSGAVNFVKYKDVRRSIQETRKRMKRLGAKKVHYLHNHPSGSAWMSEADKMMAGLIKLKLKSRLGEYVVIDHGKYAYMDEIDAKLDPGETKKFTYKAVQDQRDVKPMRGAGMWMVGKQRAPSLNTPTQVAAFALDLMKKNRTVVAFIDAQNQLQGWASVSDNLFLKPNWKHIITDYTKAHDASSAMLITSSSMVRNLGNSPVGNVLTEILFDKGEDVYLDDRFESMRKHVGVWFEEREGVRGDKNAFRLFEKQKPYGEDLTAEQKEALERAKEQVAKLMYEAKQRGIKFGRKYLKSRGYTPKQITQILKVKRFMQNQAKDLGTPRENAVAILEMHLRNAEKMKVLKKRDWMKLKRQLKRGVVDVSGNIKPKLMAAGDPGKMAVISHDLSAGSSSYAEMQYEGFLDKVYGKGEWGEQLSRENEEILNMVINSRRIVTIDNYKENMKHPEGYTGDHHSDYLDYENFKHAFKTAKKPDGTPVDMEISEDLYDELMERADLWFDEANKQLKQLYQNHLISEASYDAMVEIGDYAPRNFIQHIDPERSYSFGGKTINVHDSGIKHLTTGSYEALETDSRKLMHQIVTRTQNRIARNKANLALWDLADQVPDNGIVRKAVIQSYNTKGVPNFEKTPPKHERIEVMIEGQRKALIMPDEWAREWVMRDPSIDNQVANWIGWLSGAKLLRPMATGMFAPEFFITNLARDAAHLWVVTNTFSSFLPYAMAQYGKAIKAVYKDALTKQGIYKDYIKYGGGMHFLTTQGHVFPSTTSKAIKNIEKVGSYLGESSEIINRLALMQQEMWNRGIDKYEEGSPEYEKIMQEAVWVARNYIDFYQGGSWAKMLDTGVPYLNAGIQGTRGIIRALYTDPKKTIWKISQLMTLAALLYLANRFINKDTQDRISDSDLIRYWCITLPGEITDSKGNKRGVYMVVAKDQGQRFFAQIAEQSMRAITGEPVMWNAFQESFKDMIPIIPTDILPPTLDAIYGYRNNKDFWLNKDIWRNKYYGVGKIEAKDEFTAYTHPALVEIGDKTALSPERLGYILKQYFTSGNILTSLVGGSTRMMMGKLPGNEGDKVLAEMLAKYPGFRRMIRLTRVTPDAERREADEALQTIYTRRYRQQRKVRALSEEYYAQKKQNMPEAELTIKELDAYIKEQPKGDQQRLVDMHDDYPKYDDIPDRSWWLSLRQMPAEAKAYVFFSKWKRATAEKRKQLDSMRGDMPGMMSDAFMDELRKLHKQSKELEK